MNIEQRLIAIRQDRGISQAEIGRLVHKSQSAVSKMEANGDWTIREAQAYAAALGIKLILDCV